MKTEHTRELVYAVVKLGNKHRTIKVIKVQIFKVQNNIKHHLIGNLYYSLLRNRPINIIKEKAHCHIKPIILTKFTFRHTPFKRKKPSLFNKQPYYLKLKDY